MYIFSEQNTLLTSQRACITGNLQINAINIFSYDGWYRWIGSEQDYFTLGKHEMKSNTSGTVTTYSIKVKSHTFHEKNLNGEK